MLLKWHTDTSPRSQVPSWLPPTDTAKQTALITNPWFDTEKQCIKSQTIRTIPFTFPNGQFPSCLAAEVTMSLSYHQWDARDIWKEGNRCNQVFRFHSRKLKEFSNDSTPILHIWNCKYKWWVHKHLKNWKKWTYFLCEVKSKNSSAEQDGGDKRVMYLKEV